MPKHYYLSDDPGNPGNKPAEQVQHATIAYHLLRHLNMSTRVVRGDIPLPAPVSRLRTLVVTSSLVDGSEVEALLQWTQGGGRLLWHGLSKQAFDVGGGAAVALVSWRWWC